VEDFFWGLRGVVRFDWGCFLGGGGGGVLGGVGGGGGGGGFENPRYAIGVRL